MVRRARPLLPVVYDMYALSRPAVTLSRRPVARAMAGVITSFRSFDSAFVDTLRSTGSNPEAASLLIECHRPRPEKIEATKQRVNAVLPVGGFGQSACLRETLRKALGSSVKVMVAQNG